MATTSIPPSEYKSPVDCPPGDMIKELMAARGMGINCFAGDMCMSIKKAEGLLEGKVEITEEIAENLYFVFGVAVIFWLNLEHYYRKWLDEAAPITPSVKG